MGDVLTFSCACRYRQAKCDMRGCHFFAGYSVHLPWHNTFKFMCNWHYAAFHKAITQRIPGLDRSPNNKDEDWRPNIRGIVEFAQVALNDEKRHQEEQAERWMPAPSRYRTPLPAKFVARLEQLAKLEQLKKRA